MADDSKYRDIICVTLVDGERSQLFSIDRDFNLWTMYMKFPLDFANWTDWEKFPLPGTSGGVTKLTSMPGQVPKNPNAGPRYPRIWAVDVDNQLWSCNGILNPGKSPWGDWTVWAPPYPND